MIEEESGENKIFGILPYIIIFSLMSMISVTVALLMYGINNDYIFYNLQNVSEELAADGVMQQSYADLSQSFFDNYHNVPPALDYIWLAIYIIFILTTLAYSYQAKRVGYIGVFGYIFFGIMILLFVASIVDTITSWWKTEILFSIMPSAIYSMPMYSYYISNLGILILLQTIGCFIANVIDFDLSKLNARKKKEQDAIENEVL